RSDPRRVDALRRRGDQALSPHGPGILRTARLGGRRRPRARDCGRPGIDRDRRSQAGRENADAGSRLAPGSACAPRATIRMRPLPRLFALPDLSIARDPDFGIKAAAILSVGSAVAIVARAPEASAPERLQLIDRVRALARPAEAATIAHADPALAKA